VARGIVAGGEMSVAACDHYEGHYNTVLLVIKFGKVGETGPFGFLFWTIRFWQFSEQEREMS
jgi:hypothetical protein